MKYTILLLGTSLLSVFTTIKMAKNDDNLKISIRDKLKANVKTWKFNALKKSIIRLKDNCPLTDDKMRMIKEFIEEEYDWMPKTHFKANMFKVFFK